MIHLVNPSERSILDNAGDRVPHGLVKIASYLHMKGEDVKVYDLNHEEEHVFMTNLMMDKSPTIGISVYTSPSFPEAVRLSGLVRRYGRTIAGGHHATHMPETLTRYFDTVVRGEGEEGMLAALKVDGVISPTPPDLSKMPGSDYNFVKLDNYGVSQSGKRTGTLITSRGCLYDCSFCGKLERKVRYEPLENVRREIEELEESGFESLYFLDDIFTLKPDRMGQIVDMVNVPYRVTSRSQMLSSDVLNKLKATGCEWVSLGIESGNDEILKRSNKNQTTKDNYSAIARTSARGINTKGFFILGLPGETEQTAKQTIDFSKRLRDIGLTSADFYYLTPFPGTPIWKNPEKFGIEIVDTDYTKYLEAGKTAKCVVNTEGLEASRIEELVEEARAEWKN